MTHKIWTKGLLGASALGGFMLLGASQALAVDWDSVTGKDVVLFYPGQASWEWVLTQSSHSGAKKFREGKNCRGCHDGEAQTMGELIVSGKKLEPMPVERKRGAVPLNVKFARDDERLYVRLQWTEQGINGFPTMDPDNEAKITVMFDDGDVREAARAGCWGVCHDDAAGMASAAEGSTLKKYLSKSRTKIARSGGGENYKTDDEIAALAAEGHFLEYWQAKLNHRVESEAYHGMILEARHEYPDNGVEAVSSYEHGKWTVVLSRPLAASGSMQMDFVPGKTYNVGFAVHEAYAAGRFHHVSFEYTMQLGAGDVDFVAASR